VAQALVFFVHPVQEGRMKPRRREQGALPFQYQAEPDGDEVTAWAGLPLIEEVLLQIRLDKPAAALGIRQRDRGFTEFEMIASAVELLAAGGECLDDLEMLRRDRALARLMNREFPSADTMRRFLDAFHDEALLAQRPPAEVQAAWIAPESERLRRLDGVLRYVVHVMAKNEPEPLRVATLDHDATIIEAHKKGALPHFKGGRGYQPAIVVWAETEAVVADEFRDGNVPAGTSTLPLIERAFAALPETVTERFFRADSACYEIGVLKWLAEPSRKIGFTISADMGRTLRSACCDVPAEAWKLFDARPDEEIHVADVPFVPSGSWPKTAEPLRYVALRYTRMQGELFEDGSGVKYWAVVTNRTGAAGELVDWHRLKAGTVEKVHDVTKNDLGARVLPSGKYGANAAWYRLVMVAHNVLTLMKRLTLAPELRDARPKRLRFRLFTLPAKVLMHARLLIARVAEQLLAAGSALLARNRGHALVPI
jgi:hypothetical protein